MIFHNGSKYDYRFIKELGEDFGGESTSLGENSEK